MRAELVNDGILYIMLKCCWYVNIVLNVHVSLEDKTDEEKSSFDEELVRVFNQFHSTTQKCYLISVTI